MYAPIAVIPRSERENSPAIFDYRAYQASNNQLTGYVKIKLDVTAALALADRSPYPRGVRLAVMQQVANTKEITLEQMRILLGWAARKAQEGMK